MLLCVFISAEDAALKSENRKKSTKKDFEIDFDDDIDFDVYFGKAKVCAGNSKKIYYYLCFLKLLFVLLSLLDVIFKN